MSSKDLIEMEGKVVEVLAGSKFRVQIDEGAGKSNHIVLAHLGGKVRHNKIKVLLGDRVRVAVSPYDPTKGPIIYRYQ